MPSEPILMEMSVPTKETTDLTTAKNDIIANAGDAGAPDKQASFITLEQLAGEMKINPRDARMLLRLAAKQKATYPTLGKDHVARQPWQWAPGSKALTEARKALAATS